MSEITRYDMVSDDGLDSLDLGPCPDGEYVRYSDHARLLAEAEAEVADWKRALDRSPYDISPCLWCGEPVVCLPDGMPMCEPCADKEESPDAE